MIYLYLFFESLADKLLPFRRWLAQLIYPPVMEKEAIAPSPILRAPPTPQAGPAVQYQKCNGFCTVTPGGNSSNAWVCHSIIGLSDFQSADGRIFRVAIVEESTARGIRSSITINGQQPAADDWLIGEVDPLEINFTNEGVIFSTRVYDDDQLCKKNSAKIFWPNPTAVPVSL